MNVKQKFKEVVKWLDTTKFLILNKNIAFSMAIKYSNGDYQCIGIGDGSDMSELILEQIYNLHKSATREISSEDFVKSVCDNYVKYKEYRDKFDNIGSVQTIRFGKE